MRLTKAIGLVLAVGVFATHLHAQGTEKKAASSRSARAVSPQRVSADDKRKTRILMNRFRKARGDVASRQKVMKEIAAFGDFGRRSLLSVVERELATETNSYLPLFQRAADAKTKRRLQAVDANEVRLLRQRVLGLRRKPELTKEDIVREGDPAMKRLTELLVLPIEEVRSDGKIKQHRERLLQTLGYVDTLSADQDVADSPGLSWLLMRLETQEKTFALASMPMSPQSRSRLIRNLQIAGKIHAEEWECIAACSLTRMLLGLEVLEVDTRLCEASRDHSSDMSKHRFFAHTSPIPGKATPDLRAKNFGTTCASENIFEGMKSGAKANESWFHSPGHHRNLLGDFQRIGVGYQSKHFTEMFGN